MLLYLHVPFCRAKCRYCAFYSRPLTDEGLLEAWASALEADMTIWGQRFKQRGERPLVTSIFFGGGTPSLVPPARIGSLLERAAREFCLAPDLEVSMEANPESVTLAKARALRDAGINRVSLGVQALDDDLLRAVGRIHSRSDALAAYSALRSTFDNVGLDFIWGLPGESLESWERQLHEAASLRPDHLSCYGLILEEGTPLWDQHHALDLPDEVTQAAMYTQCGEILERYGYRQYEISNYALPGRECRHNLGYWMGRDYLGLGPSAVSAFGSRRWTQPADLDTWLSAPREALMPEGGQQRPAPCGRTPASFGSARPVLGTGSRLIDLERLSFREQAEELIMLRLRTARGLPLDEYQRFTGRDFAADNAALITALVDEGLACMIDDKERRATESVKMTSRKDEENQRCPEGESSAMNGITPPSEHQFEGPRFALTRAGMLISNAIIERCFDAIPAAPERNFKE